MTTSGGTRFPFFQVDAFADVPLSGNPAAVMPLSEWPEDTLLQAIAAENNLSETAFTVPLEGSEADFHLRWFTPTVEVDLCGHATLAAAHLLLNGNSIAFQTRSGILRASRSDDLVWIDLPAEPVLPTDDPQLLAILGLNAGQVWRGHSGNGARIVLLPNENAVRAVAPDFTALQQIDSLVIVTAPGKHHPIASRVFAAAYGIPEDPVTGSAHCALVPFWADRLQRREFSAFQASKRGGLLQCRLEGDDRVKLGGRCFTVIEGSFRL